MVCSKGRTWPSVTRLWTVRTPEWIDNKAQKTPHTATTIRPTLGSRSIVINRGLRHAIVMIAYDHHSGHNGKK